MLGVITDLTLPDRQDHRRVLQAVRALLDFVYIAQYPEMSATCTIKQLKDALTRFHSAKTIFIKLGARQHFNLPKITLAHYVEAIQLCGTPDNFNTSYSERLHIDYTKSAYRATNRKDEYPQMTLWYLRREQILAHRTYVCWRLADRPSTKNLARAPLPGMSKLRKNIASAPNVEYLSFAKAGSLHGTQDFKRHLAEYILTAKYPLFTKNNIGQLAPTTVLPFQSVGAFHRLKFWHEDALDRDSDLVQDLPDSVVARPAYHGYIRHGPH